MTLQIFLKKINWRFIAVHGIAAWFIMQACPWLFYLSNVRMFVGVQKWAFEEKSLSTYVATNNIASGQLITYFFWVSATWLLGLVTATIASFIIARKQKVFWVNSLLVFVVLYSFHFFDIDGWVYAKRILLVPGKLFHYPVGYLLANGLVMLAIGGVLFWLWWVKGQKRAAIAEPVALTHPN